MGRQFGIASVQTAAGVEIGIVVTSFQDQKTAEIAEARDGEGKVTDLKAYSRGTTKTFTGLLDQASPDIDAGDALTYEAVQYIVESANINRTNTTYCEVTITARTADAAAISPYSSGATT